MSAHGGSVNTGDNHTSKAPTQICQLTTKDTLYCPHCQSVWWDGRPWGAQTPHSQGYHCAQIPLSAQAAHKGQHICKAKVRNQLLNVLKVRITVIWFMWRHIYQNIVFNEEFDRKIVITSTVSEENDPAFEAFTIQLQMVNSICLLETYSILFHCRTVMFLSTWVMTCCHHSKTVSCIVHTPDQTVWRRSALEGGHPPQCPWRWTSPPHWWCPLCHCVPHCMSPVPE